MKKIIFSVLLVAMISAPFISGNVSAAGNLEHGAFSLGAFTYGWATYREVDHEYHRARLWLCSGFGNTYNYNGSWEKPEHVSETSGTRAGILVHTAAGQTKNK